MKFLLLTCLSGLCLCGMGKALAMAEGRERRNPVHPGRNVEEFPAAGARWLRFTILRTMNGTQPCLDELEVYGPEAPEKNLALASLGTRVRASGTLPDYRIHALSHVNDGLYGNGHSWIAGTSNEGWVELEFPAPVRIDRVVWSRDRERKFIDRLAVEYRIEISSEPGQWQVVASSEDRAPLPAVSDFGLSAFGAPGTFGAMSTDLAGSDRPAAREYGLKTWQSAGGLPSNTVTALCQTRDGWLWAGTTNGPARFDGRRFTVFGESHGLKNLGITCLLEDGHGRLWLGTEGGGLARWEDGRFHHLATGAGLAANTVLALAEDDGGTLWIGTADGLLCCRGAEAPVLVMRGRFPKLAFSEGKLWTIWSNRLAYLEGNLMIEPPVDLDPSRFSSMTALAADGQGALWFGGANGYVGRLSEGKVKTFGEGHVALTSNASELLVTRGGDLWIGTSASGLARLRGVDLLPLTTDDGLPSNSLRALCEDREGNLWAGTAGGGLTRLRPCRVRTLSTRDGLSHNGIMALVQAEDGTVWLGTNGGGLNRWRDGEVRLQTPSYLLENKTISSLAVRRDGSLWLGTAGTGAFRWAAGRLTRWTTAEGLPGQIVTAFCEDRQGRLWLGTLDGGPACFDGKTITLPAEAAPLAGHPVTSLVEDGEGALWFGTNGRGVARLGSDGGLTRWTRDEGLASDFVRTLRVDATGTVWAGTNGGLTRWKDGRVFSYTAAHGLANTVISQILDDEAGHLWLGTNGGVFRVTLASLEQVAAGAVATLETFALGLDDGLPSLECTGGYHPAGLRTQDGLLCFGTVAGLAVIDPADFTAPAVDPPVMVESVALGAETIAVLPAGPLPAPPSVSRLAFTFTAPSFGAPERLRFRYRMAGLENEWVDAGPERAATYTHLAPGAYTFEVIAKPDGGAWSSRPAQVMLRVLAPWWKKPWALATGAGLGLAVVAGTARFVTRRRLQRRLREVERQFALERERSRIARDIHDDLGANLTQIGLLSALGAAHSHDPAQARARFEAIGATSGELVQAMDSIVWAVNPSQDTLEGLARYLVRFAVDFFAATPVRLRVEVPEQLPAIELSSEVRHNLFLAAKEALHNALHHAAATEVHLRLTAHASELCMEIADNDRGFTPEAAASAGNGLGNMRHRLAECGGACDILSTPGQGTRVRLTLPLPLSV